MPRGSPHVSQPARICVPGIRVPRQHPRGVFYLDVKKWHIPLYYAAGSNIRGTYYRGNASDITRSILRPPESYCKCEYNLRLLS